MPHLTRAAFSIVEALVATTIIGMAGSVLAASLTATGALRARAAARSLVATITRAHVADLSARACTAPDTAGLVVAVGATGAWTAHRTGAGWTFSDSVRAGRADMTLIEGSVACRR